MIQVDFMNAKQTHDNKTAIARRSFLKKSLILGGAAMATGYFPAPQLATAGLEANRQMGVMVVGAGGRGGNHISAMVDDSRTVVRYVCDPDRSRAEESAQKAGEKQGFAPKVIADMREALDDVDLDIVTCATVNHWHTLCGIWALQKGKHVFLEKPISSTVYEGKAIVAAAQKYGKICQVGTQRRSQKAFIDAVKFVRDGGIGEVKLARGICYKRRKSIGELGNYDVPAEVDYNLWCGPTPDVPLTRPHFHYDWHWQRICGNGEIGNNGPHFCDLGRWFLGLDRFPDRVFSYGARVGYQIERKDPKYVDAGDTPNTHVTVFEFGDKTIVMECRGLETPKYRDVDFGAVIFGSEGYMTTNGKCVAFDNDGKVVKEFTGGGNNFKGFLDAVEKNDASLVKADARCGAISAALCHLGNIAYYVGEPNQMPFDEIGKAVQGFNSAPVHDEVFRDTKAHLRANGIDTGKTLFALGNPLKLDFEKEIFVENEKANQLMKRPDRAEFAIPDLDRI